MRPRAGTEPVTLEPSMVVEVLSLARTHDEMLKETRQDLFRAETKLNIESRWKWPIRFACVALGALGVLAFQNDMLKAWLVEAAARILWAQTNSWEWVEASWLRMSSTRPTSLPAAHRQ